MDSVGGVTCWLIVPMAQYMLADSGVDTDWGIGVISLDTPVGWTMRHSGQWKQSQCRWPCPPEQCSDDVFHEHSVCRPS